MAITREEWSWQFDYCFACGRKPWGVLGGLQTHEIARGPHRQKALKEPAAWLRLCARCHERLPADIAYQLRLKRDNDPEHYDRIAVNWLRGREGDAVTEADVDAAKE